MNTLFLRLEGPLQSWGLRSRWGERETALEPSKSGVIGVLGSALGLGRDRQELRTLSDQLKLGVRVDLPGTLLYDYHTTGGGQYGPTEYTGGPRFHDQPYIGGVLSPEVTKGRIKVKINASTKQPETDVSERIYLGDASFLIALRGTEELIGQLARAVQNPVWPYYLGRKSCPPATPIFVETGEHGSLELALKAAPIPSRVRESAEKAGRPLRLRLLLESSPGRGVRQNDAIGTPGRRVFLPRYVEEQLWSPDEGDLAINTLEG